MAERNNKTCAFFGHRNAFIDSSKYKEIECTIEKLIVNFKINIFLFGSRSKFDDVCLKIVSQLKIKYPYIIRKKYTCLSEACILEEDKGRWEDIYKKVGFNINEIAVYDEEVHFKDKLKAGALSYIKRNYSMIDNSDICVFYYSENYVPKPNSNSGTKIAYNYAKRKKKILINLI